MDYKMIFSDMDGTLLKNDRAISDRNKEAIQKAVAQGVDFVLCTGRGMFGVAKFVEELSLVGQEGYIVCQNGATVYNRKNMELEIYHGFASSIMSPIAKEADRLGVEVFYYDNLKFMASQETPIVKEYCKAMNTAMEYLKEPLEYDGMFTKCLIAGEHEKLLQLQKEIRYLEQDEVDTFFSNPRYLEVVKKGVNKGNAMSEIARKNNIPLRQVIAVGDSENDISMIRQAGLGVAVANAIDDVKAAADFVTERTCTEHAIAELIERFVL